MLQQTTVATVKGYFAKFLGRWPSIKYLAASSHDELMQCWQGLGYYSRARNLHKTAKIITDQFNGIIPDSYQELIKLPGIGHYTAAAVAAIAFKEPIIAIDTNVNRVLCRLFGISSIGKNQKLQVQEIADQFAHPKYSGNLSQALMDLGSDLCKSKTPRCCECFLKTDCLAYLNNLQNILPYKPKKQDRPKRYGHSFVIRHGNQLLIEKRPDKGLLAGLYQFPTSELLNAQVAPEFPFQSLWQPIGAVRHIFTHFELELTLWETFLPDVNQGVWVEFENLGNYGLPTMYKKALAYIKNPVLD